MALFDVDVFGPMNIWNALAIGITVVVVGAERRVLPFGRKRPAKMMKSSD
jgi:hypothetical protein